MFRQCRSEFRLDEGVQLIAKSCLFWKLECGNYSREETIVFFLFGSGNFSGEEFNSTQNSLFLLSTTRKYCKNEAQNLLRMTSFGFLNNFEQLK